MSLAAKIRELRLHRGESLQNVADSIGISKTHIWELEKGRSQNPSMELLAKIADHFKISHATLIGENLDDTSNDEQLVRMFRQAGELDPRDRKTVDSLIQSLRQNAKDDDFSN